MLFRVCAKNGTVFVTILIINQFKKLSYWSILWTTILCHLHVYVYLHIAYLPKKIIQICLCLHSRHLPLRITIQLCKFWKWLNLNRLSATIAFQSLIVCMKSGIKTALTFPMIWYNPGGPACSSSPTRCSIWANRRRVSLPAAWWRSIVSEDGATLRESLRTRIRPQLWGKSSR